MIDFLKFIQEQKFFALGSHPDVGPIGSYVHDDGKEDHPSRSINTLDAIGNEPFKDKQYFRSPKMKKYIGSLRKQFKKNSDEIPDISVTPHPSDPSKYSVIDGNHRLQAARVSRIERIRGEMIPHDNIRLLHPDHLSNPGSEKEMYEKGIPLTSFRNKNGSYDMDKPRPNLGGLTLNHYFAK